jgi:hypothetical protein
MFNRIWPLIAVFLLLALAAARAQEFRRTTIYQAPSGQSAMYVQFTPLVGGELLCAFRLAIKNGNNPWTVPGSKIVCLRSHDNGQTWSKAPVLIYQDKDSSAYTSQCGLGYQAQDGTILVPFYVVSMTGEGRPEHIHWNCIAASRDDGRTWYSRPLPSEPFLTNPTYGGFQRAHDGSLWMLERCRGYGLDLADLYLRQKSWLEIRSCVRIMRSSDEGTTWKLLSYVGYDPTRADQTARFPELFKEDEPALLELPSGKILLIGRPHMYQAMSTDRGQTWQIGPSDLTRIPGRQKEMSGLSPALWHSSAGPPGGTTILAYHDRWGEHAQTGGVYLRFSYDEGTTWGKPTFLAPGAYPALYEYQPGKMFCGYYRSNSLLEAAFFQVPTEPTGGRPPSSRSTRTASQTAARLPGPT